MTRLYFSGEMSDHGQCMIKGAQAHHVLHVLRLAAGSEVTLFNGHGVEFAATIVRADKNAVTLNIRAQHLISRESPLMVTLAQGISSGERMDYTVQKAVELGISEIQPLQTTRSVVRLAGVRAAKRTAHWHAVAIASCEQCGRNFIPKINELRNILDWVATPISGLRVLFSPRAETRLQQLPHPAGAITILAGPEGGLSPEEESAALARGFVAVRLGPRVLRTETAAVAALAAMQTLWGDF